MPIAEAITPWTTIQQTGVRSWRRVSLLMRRGILWGARDERQSGAVAPGAAPLGRDRGRNGCRNVLERRRAAPRRARRRAADRRSARGRCRGSQAARRRVARGSGACRGTPTARGRGGGGTPWRTGRAGGSRRGGRPRGRSAAAASSSAARSIRTRREVLAEGRVADLGVGALQLASRGRDAARDVVERQVGAVLGLDDGYRVTEEARAMTDRGWALNGEFHDR